MRVIEDNPATKMPDEIKAALEIEKLRLELQDLQRPWWKRPAYLQALLPLCIAAITAGAGLTVAWTQGFFDGQRAKLLVERQQLQRENADAQEQLNHATQKLYETRQILRRLSRKDLDQLLTDDERRQLNSIPGGAPTSLR